MEKRPLQERIQENLARQRQFLAKQESLLSRLGATTSTSHAALSSTSGNYRRSRTASHIFTSNASTGSDTVLESNGDSAPHEMEGREVRAQGEKQSPKGEHQSAEVPSQRKEWKREDDSYSSNTAYEEDALLREEIAVRKLKAQLAEAQKFRDLCEQREFELVHLRNRCSQLEADVAELDLWRDKARELSTRNRELEESLAEEQAHSAALAEKLESVSQTHHSRLSQVEKAYQDTTSRKSSLELEVSYLQKSNEEAQGKVRSWETKYEEAAKELRTLLPEVHDLRSKVNRYDRLVSVMLTGPILLLSMAWAILLYDSYPSSSKE